MIKSAKQALRIQNARVAQNKRFYAHAVRRWCKRTGYDVKSLPRLAEVVSVGEDEAISPMSDEEFKKALGILEVET